MYRDFMAPDPAVDPATRRNDEEFRISLANDFQFSRDWSVLWQLQYIETISNLPNFTHDNLRTFVAAKRRF